MPTFIFGYNSSQVPIFAYRFGYSKNHVLVLGGVHGNETEGVYLSQVLLEHCLKQFSLDLSLTIVPIFNPHGVYNHQRCNDRNVDLNRNLPTKDWNHQTLNPRYPPGPNANSEPENQALVQWIELNQPTLIISLHSWYPLLNTNGNCLSVAQVIQKWTHYKIEESIGYPTPGCLGTFAGLEKNIPTLTYEIERGLSAPSIKSIHLPALIEGLKAWEDGSK
ncbi:MAG: DUF2817 domain-containing protein [Bdellovibrionales bacterium]|nr:DUF2817 domain-containing protein [Bdellovibrionales bacterium]